MKLKNKIDELKNTYNIISEINLDTWHDLLVHERKLWLKKELLTVFKAAYQSNDRIIFTLTRGDIYESDESPAGQIVTSLMELSNEIDISNFFIVLLSNDIKFIPLACEWVMANISKDPVPFTHIAFDDVIDKKLLVEKLLKQDSDKSKGYNSLAPLKVELSSLSEKHQYLLTESKTFCMYPWVHLHAYPTGAAYPCCQAEMSETVGSTRNNTLEEIWNDAPMKSIRSKMLTDKPVDACIRCYEQEQVGMFSGRQSANKHHGHHITRVDETQPDGTLDQFSLTYWDIRFSNLCNLSCRSCGHIFSSSWHQDQKKLVLLSYWNNVKGPSWPENPPKTLEEFHQLPEFVRNELINDFGGEIISHLKYVKTLPVLNYAGSTKTDMWEQLIPHLDYVEQIYFAGGEPLMMEEHYNILDELERRGRFDVRLVYNTNFTQTKLKDRVVFDYWRKFDSVSIGASLDAMGPRAEYIRKGTDWDTVERNRELMMEICPKVDFYISPTLSIMNALHLPDFHRNWVEKGYIKPQDLNVNVLQDPVHYRIDIAPIKYKQRIRQAYAEHLEWLRPLDPLNRATVGFESAINFMMATDNSSLIPRFWTKTTELDSIRREEILKVIPELEALK